MVILSNWQLFSKMQSRKVFSVAAQGIKALETHTKGTKHIQRLPNSSTGKICFTSSSNTVIASEPKNAATKVKQTLIVPLTENQSTKQAEVIWTLDVLSKYSFWTSDNKAELFSAMFPDSQIAQKFTCGQTKSKYLRCHALAPYFKELLGKTLSEVEHFVCLFNESHNHVIKKVKWTCMFGFGTWQLTQWKQDTLTPNS